MMVVLRLREPDDAAAAVALDLQRALGRHVAHGLGDRLLCHAVTRGDFRRRDHHVSVHDNLILRFWQP